MDDSKPINYFYSLSGFLATLLAFFISRFFHVQDISTISWLILILGVDVSHVYSTLYRTYFNKTQRLKLNKILIFVPLVCFTVSLSLAFYRVELFWTVLAYLAIFHFSRQQIGFLRRLCAVKDRFLNFLEFVIYTSTLGPILLWHLQGQKSFNWFTKMDLFYLDQITSGYREVLFACVQWVVILIFLAGIMISVVCWFQKKITIHVPLIVMSTFISWYFPIVVFNSDFIFTMANVIAHGIPYLALVWSEENRTQSTFRRAELFFIFILLFALLEEAFWDALVWREQGTLFNSFYFLPHLQPSSAALSLVLALLILPQMTHYALDGFIWKKKYHQ